MFADGFRLGGSDPVVFDVHGVGTVDYFARPSWDGVMPPALFGTIAASLLAGRGLLPVHATAIEWRGKAFLIAGAASAGKSTLSAELLAAGARLIGDDLSAIDPPADGAGGFMVRRGRWAMRLHPDSAARVAGEVSQPVPRDPRGKVLLRPERRSSAETLPLAAILLLEAGDHATPIEAAAVLQRLLFRPRWFAALPCNRQRRTRLVELAGAVPLRRLPPVAGFTDQIRAARVERAVAIMS